jgi:hypothetical protein
VVTVAAVVPMPEAIPKGDLSQSADEFDRGCRVFLHFFLPPVPGELPMNGEILPPSILVCLVDQHRWQNLTRSHDGTDAPFPALLDITAGNRRTIVVQLVVWSRLALI